MRKAILGSMIGAIMICGLTTPAYAQSVTNDDTWVYVYQNDELVHQSRTCGDNVFTTTELNLRTGPSFDSDIVTVIPSNVKLFRVGKHDKWTVVQIAGVNYFVATQHITEIEPEIITDWIFTPLVETSLVVTEPVQYSGQYLGDWTITFYCNCSECCGQWAGGLTVSGTEPTEGRTVACGSLDFGTEIYIEGLGDYVVEDRGVEGNWIDIYLDSHEACNQMGMMSRGVYVK